MATLIACYQQPNGNLWKYLQSSLYAAGISHNVSGRSEREIAPEISTILHPHFDFTWEHYHRENLPS